MTMNKKYLWRLARRTYLLMGVAIEGEIKSQLANWVRGTANAVYEEWPESRLVKELGEMAEGDLANETEGASK